MQRAYRVQSHLRKYKTYKHIRFIELNIYEEKMDDKGLEIARYHISLKKYV